MTWAHRAAFGLVSESEIDGIYTIALSQRTDGDGRSLILQDAPDHPDDQDIGLGHDTYCLVLDPGQHTMYGGIVECVIEQQHLRLRLSPAAAETLDVEPLLRFRLDLDPTQIALVRVGLRRILSNGRPEATPQHLQL